MPLLYLVVFSICGLMMFWGVRYFFVVLTAYKKDQIVLFSSVEKDITQHVYAFKTIEMADNFVRVLPEGRYVITAPSGYHIVGPNSIELLPETNSLVTMQNEEGNQLFTRVTTQVLV